MTGPFPVAPLRIADAARAIRHVFIHDLVLDAQIGVHPHERGRAQPIRVNVDLGVIEGPNRTSDRPRDIVCYQELADTIRAIVAEGHVLLVETLAERIAQACLADPRVQSARIRIEKPQAISDAASAGVEIERTRPEAAETI